MFDKMYLGKIKWDIDLKFSPFETPFLCNTELNHSEVIDLVFSGIILDIL